jgi:hypothetical protein
MGYPLSHRCAAEAIEQFGDDLAKLNRAFDRLCERMPSAYTDAINAIPMQDHLDQIAEDFRKLGDGLCRDLDDAEEASDRRRANPLEPDFRSGAR